MASPPSALGSSKSGKRAGGKNPALRIGALSKQMIFYNLSSVSWLDLQHVFLPSLSTTLCTHLYLFNRDKSLELLFSSSQNVGLCR